MMSDFEKARKYLSRIDPDLRAVIKRSKDLVFEPHHAREPYHMLMRSIAHQQLTGKAAETILGRFVALYAGKEFPLPDDVIKTPHETIRSVGFSNAKAAAIREIALKTKEGIVPSLKILHELSDEEIIERLTSIKGIGRWTVEMLLIFNLGRPDIFPATDYGVRKGFAKLYNKRKLPTPAKLSKHAEKWKPHRSLAAWYLWRVLEL